MRTRSKPLSAGFCRTIKTPGRYGDGGRGSNGLYLRVWERANGRIGKAWAQRLQINGKPTNLGLGPYPVVSLKEARAKALENRRAAYQGRDPRSGGMPTFREAAEKVIALRSRSWKTGSRQPGQWRQTFRDHVHPVIGSKAIGDVTTSDVLAVLTPIWASKPGAARVVRTRIGVVMRWAVAKGYRGDNPAGEAISAALPANGGHVHFKAARPEQVADILAAVDGSTSQPAVKLAIRFAVFTACRSAECLGARWSEIEGDTWTIPAARMKGGKRAFRVPLSSAALEVLRQARELHDGDLVFPSKATGRRLNPSSLTHVLRTLNLPTTIHGFRSSFRDWAGETGVPREVAEAALAHIVKGVEGAYARSDLLERRREVAEAWGAYLEA